MHYGAATAQGAVQLAAGRFVGPDGARVSLGGRPGTLAEVLASHEQGGMKRCDNSRQAGNVLLEEPV